MGVGRERLSGIFWVLAMYSSVLREQAAITIYDDLVEASVLDVDNHTKP